MKKLAIIGRPNVGKSSFFNRLLKQRDAITSEQAGTTRDIKRRILELGDKEVEILDTGGLDEGNELFDAIKKMSIKAAHEADIILYMVDGKSLPEEEDKAFFYELQEMGKTMALVVNKIDNDKMMEKVWDYYEFGCDNIFGISVSHNRHINALLEWIEEQLPEKEPEEERLTEESPLQEEEEEAAPLEEEEDFDDDFFEEIEDEDDGYFNPLQEYYEGLEEAEEFEAEEMLEDKEAIREYDEEALNKMRVAIIGRVNVGKSSLLNALLHEERSVVSSVAGTTIDPIDETVEYKDKEITFIDTAGVRKRGKILGIEKYALMRTEAMLEDADIALLVLDASEPFKELDEKIAGLIDQNRMACLIVLNKWDIVDGEKYQQIVQDIRDRFKFLHYAPIITISAQSGQRVQKIYDKLLEINENYSQRISTSKLNEVLEWAQRKHHLPSMNGQMIRIYFATQYDIRPPRIALIMNKPKGLHFTYRRYLTNQLREAFNFEGVPILFKAKAKNEKRRLKR
ncbi:ribosome biogenesis GTPase Der [Sulfurimonas sp. HSL3-7]|uniref:ribosome biogenesis GTPase Der n=1 Tax=Sulfonitrofixus jiaomeiensis TaxID=3131938 RepID=UPI0031F99160